MDRVQFSRKLTEYLEALEREALKLFDAGVAAERCMTIAHTIVEAQIVEQVRRRQVLAAPFPIPIAKN